MVHTQEGCFHYVCIKFEADCSIRSNVIKGFQNLEIRSRDPGHANLGVVFRLDALALSVIATATWLAGWLSHSGIVSKLLNLSE